MRQKKNRSINQSITIQIIASEDSFSVHLHGLNINFTQSDINHYGNMCLFNMNFHLWLAFKSRELSGRLYIVVLCVVTYPPHRYNLWLLGWDTRAHEISLFNKHQYCLSRSNCNCKIIIETNSNYINSDGDSCVHVDRVMGCKPCRTSIQLMV